MSSPVAVTTDSFQREVLEESSCAVVVDFWSATCPHCLRFNPEFEAAAGTLAGEVKFTKITAQEGMEVFREHQVRSTPTSIVFRDGQEIARREGFLPAAELVEWVRQTCAE